MGAVIESQTKTARRIAIGSKFPSTSLITSQILLPGLHGCSLDTERTRRGLASDAKMPSVGYGASRPAVARRLLVRGVLAAANPTIESGRSLSASLR
jgi:hypothetical protein